MMGASTTRLLTLALLLLSTICAHMAVGQTASGTLRGQVSDPSGAVIPGATVSATPATGQARTAQTDGQGKYELSGLTPGKYTVTAGAKGFTAFQQDVEVAARQVTNLDIPLQILVEQERVTVEEQGTTVDVSPTNNASALVIQGKDLDALSDDPDELQSELEALAGPSTGPNGGQIYIDGFTGGQLPPKSSIREIRINQNPFSAEYDKLGYGRIEIFTKPGTGQLHGQAFVIGNDSAFNSHPFISESPGYHSEIFNGSLSGPISKKVSFFFNAERRNINDTAIVDATVLDTAFNRVPLSQAIPTSRTRTNISPRIDFQLSPSNTLTVRYQFTQNHENNDGIGQFSLPSQAYNVSDTEQTLQISDTQILSANVVNETRFQFIHDNNTLAAQNFQPTTLVLGAFTDGGNQLGAILDKENHCELQNYTSIVHGNHFVRFGGRLRATTDSNSSISNFNGVFTFSSLISGNPLIPDYQVAAMCLATSPMGPCSGASQFSITKGPALTQVTVVDAGLYAEDTWKIRPNMTLSYGLRFETQNEIHDHGDFAPRLAFSWGLGGGKKTPPKTVLRAGFGIFYDRFAYNLVLLAERLNANGLGQTQYVVANPDFYPNVPTSGQLPSLATASPTFYQVAPNLRAPYTMQTGASVERQLTKKATVAVTYLNSRGEHQLFLSNINAPPNGIPTAGTPNLYQYTSEGIFRQNQLITNFRVNAGAKLSLFGFYTLNYANSDLGSGSSNTATGVAGFSSGGSLSTPSFISNQFDPMTDYGRAAFDVRHRVLLGGTIGLPRAFRLNPFMVVSSGQPYNVTAGQDLNGDSIFNDRPALVSAATCGTVVKQPSGNLCTPVGTFNPGTPLTGQTIVPINYGTASTLFTLNLRLSKTIGFGKEQGGPSAAGGGGQGGRGGGGGRGGPGGGGGGLGGRGLSGGGGPGGGGPFGLGGTTTRRYNLTFSVAARNIFNRVNLAPPVGNLTSPLFAQSNALAAGPFSSGSASRRIDLQVLFSF
ncbi:MAG: carboxypeptidase regulatory-like domain-containing protein [Terriglobales bacterium]